MPSPLPSGLTESWALALALLIAKATLVLAAAALAAWALRRGSAARRHLVWTMAMAALLALPALSLGLPEWEPAFLQIRTHAADGGTVGGGGGAPGGVPVGAALLAVWALGAAAVLARMALGMMGVRRVARGAHPETDPEWAAAVRALGASVGVRGRVRLLRGTRAAMPATWGIVRPTVLLPAEARGWTEERRRVVLLHELAHVARRDCATQMLATLCCAAYWFHPGAWWAARRMRVEREEACDDRVLAAGARPSEYAGHLVAVARTFRLPRPGAPALAMARGSQLQARVMAVLDAGRDRRSVPRAAGALWCTAVLAGLLPLAVVGPSEREAPAPPSPAPRAAGEVRRVEADGLHMEVRITPAPVAVAAAPPAPAPRAEPVAAAHAKPRGRPGPGRALAALVRATTHPEARVRRTAVEALGRIGDDAVVTPLVRSLRDEDSDVRTLAARVLGELASGRRAPTDFHTVPVAAAPVRRALGTAAADRAAEALRLSLADKDPKVRDTALWALGEIGGSEGGSLPLGGAQNGTGVVSTLEGGGGLD